MHACIHTNILSLGNYYYDTSEPGTPVRAPSTAGTGTHSPLSVTSHRSRFTRNDNGSVNDNGSNAGRSSKGGLASSRLSQRSGGSMKAGSNVAGGENGSRVNTNTARPSSNANANAGMRPPMASAGSNASFNNNNNSSKNINSINGRGGGSGDSGSVDQNDVQCTLNIDILDTPSYVQTESYRSLAHLYALVHEQILRYEDDGTYFGAICRCIPVVAAARCCCCLLLLLVLLLLCCFCVVFVLCLQREKLRFVMFSIHKNV
jgi:hypothetical protein